MMNVHEQHATEYLADPRWTLVGRWEYAKTAQHGPEFTRLDFVSTENTCLHEMRGWTARPSMQDIPVMHKQFGFCLLDKGHRGKHSTVVFYCDVCGRTYRGQPTYSDENVSVCYPCSLRPRQYE